MQILSTKRLMAILVVVMLVMSVFTLGVCAEDITPVTATVGDVIVDVLVAGNETAEAPDGLVEDIDADVAADTAEDIAVDIVLGTVTDGTTTEDGLVAENEATKAPDSVVADTAEDVAEDAVTDGDATEDGLVAKNEISESTDGIVEDTDEDTATTGDEETEEAEESTSKFYATFWALLPPIIAIGLALITKEVYSSLFVGILAGGLLAGGFKPLDTVDAIVGGGLISAVSDTAGIFVFLVLLGIMVALINKTGAAAAFGKWAQSHVKSRVGAQLATFVLGVLIFIDDYFNCLTVGSVMKPVTDAHKISRAKLAFIIDATAAPICMIAPISSWAAAVSEYAEGTGMGGLELFIRAIPFNYYSLMTLLFVVLIIVFKVDFGPMAKHEKNALEKGDLFTTGVSKNQANEKIEVNEKGRVIDLIIPIIILIVTCVFGLLYIGGILAGADFIKAFGDTDATVGLPWGGLVALVLTLIYLVCRRVVTFKDAMACIPKGFNAMVPAIIILTFATALKNVTIGMLGAKEFIEIIMKNSAESLALFLPAVIFLVACLLAFATGTSWGTFGILIPIVASLFSIDNPLYIIGMSACLAGAVCGDHCSPISDTTIMSSAGAECDHINHVATQIPYAVSIAGCSFVAYLVGGLTQNGWLGLAVAAVVTVGLVLVMKALTSKKAQ